MNAVTDGSSSRSFRIVYALWLFGLFAYFVPAATWSPVSRFALTHAMVDQHTVAIDALAEATGDRALRDGHFYSDKAPIPSMLAVPAYAIAHGLDRLRNSEPKFVSVSTPQTPARHISVNRTFARSLYVCSLTTAAVASVALALLMFEWLRRRATNAAALVGSLSIAVATPVLPYSTSFYGHVIAAAFLFGGFVLVTTDAPSRTWVRCAGASLALAVGSEYIVAAPAFLIVVWFLVRTEHRALSLLDLALGAAIPVIALGAYHAVCFGSPLRTGYSFLPRAEFAEGHARGFMGIELPRPSAIVGLLVSTRRGLFVMAPIAIVGVLGLAHSARTVATARLALAAFVLLLLMNAGYYMWWGGAATGPRHLIPVLPFLALGVAHAWQQPRLRLVVIALAAVSFGQMMLMTVVGLEAPEHGSALWDYAWPRARDRHIAHLSGASNLGLRVGLTPLVSLIPLAVWSALGIRVLITQLRAIRAD